ncbi:MAG: hypothetical protein GY940_13845 [bacterium]|nr:hypothetical protein [bacterium]
MSGKQNIWSTVLIGMVILVLITTGACKKSAIEVLESIILDTGQSGWNLSSANGSDVLEVFLVGDDIAKIILDSIEMKGDNPSASPLKADSANVQGSRVRALFRKSEVRKRLLNPTPGSTHTIIVVFITIDNNEPTEVHSQVTVTEPGEGSENGTSAFTLDISPDEWSLNYTKSSGTVEAFIEGEGIENIDLTSIEMTGDNASAAPLPADSVSINNDKIHARFPKNQVLGLLQDPAEGSVHTITISFLETGGTERLELTAEITIEDEDDIILEDLELEIDPDEWSLNFSNSSGTVEAFIEGEGIENIDLGSIEMMGDNPSAAPLAAESVSINKDKIHARFPKNQVLDLLLNPEEGSVHTITISFLAIGGTERLELTARITIEDDDDEEEPSEYTLQLAPPNWNLNFTGASGSVKAIIRGEGIENIDLDSLEMEGDNPGATALSATSAAHNGNHIQADFPKNQVLDLLLNPASGTTHTVTVTFTENGGAERLEVSAEVTITGNSK